MLSIGVAAAITRIRENAIGIREIFHRCEGDGVGELVIFGIASRPSEFGEARKNNTLVVGEDEIAVILAGGEDEAVVDYIIGIDEARVDEPFVGFDGFVEVVAA